MFPHAAAQSHPILSKPLPVRSEGSPKSLDLTNARPNRKVVVFIVTCLFPFVSSTEIVHPVANPHFANPFILPVRQPALDRVGSFFHPPKRSVCRSDVFRNQWLGCPSFGFRFSIRMPSAGTGLSRVWRGSVLPLCFGFELQWNATNYRRCKKLCSRMCDHCVCVCGRVRM